MKKRILCFICAIISAFSFAACSAAEISVTFDDHAPWALAEINRYEKTEYKVEKFTREQRGDDFINKTLVADGTFTQELTTNSKTTTVKYTLVINYKDTDEANSSVVNRNYTDTIYSEIRFNSAKGYSPISSVKEVICAPRLNDKGETDSDANQPLSYKWAVNYTDAETTLKFRDNSEITVPAGQMKITGYKTATFSADGGNKYDNEQLFYVTRAMSNLKTEGSQSFYLCNPFDCAIQGEHFNYTMSMSAPSSAPMISLPDAFNNFKITKGSGENEELVTKNEETGKIEVPCVEANISIASDSSGPPIKLYYVDPAYTFDFASIKTKKILMRIIQTEYNYQTASEWFRTEYNLTDYVTRQEN